MLGLSGYASESDEDATPGPVHVASAQTSEVTVQAPSKPAPDADAAGGKKKKEKKEKKEKKKRVKIQLPSAAALLSNIPPVVNSTKSGLLAGRHSASRRSWARGWTRRRCRLLMLRAPNVCHGGAPRLLWSC